VKRLIMVTGTARSGAAMIGGLVHLCGARGGRIIKVVEYDGRGSFENSAIRTSLVKPFLQGIGADPKGQNPLPSIDRCMAVAPLVAETWRRAVVKILDTETEPEAACCFASSSSCLIWPIWAKAFPEAEWIIVRRYNRDIVDSCMKTTYMDAFDNPQAWMRWVQEHHKRFAEMRSRLKVVEVWPSKMLSGDLTEVRRVIEGVGLRWDQQAVESFLAPILWQGGVFELAGEVPDGPSNGT